MSAAILDEIKRQDYAKILSEIESFLKGCISEAGAKGLVFGLSGGIDSAVVAHICARSFKENTLAIIMPDSKVSPKEETEDALYLVDTLGLEYKLVDINQIHSGFANVLEPDTKALGNLRARIRANLLYYYANLRDYLVVGSSDRSEQMIGYFTKFGDGSADVLPIVSLYKTQIRELAQNLGIKESIISKKSSPHLWSGHTAEDEIGVSYEEIDCILHCIVDRSLSVDETASRTLIDREKVERIHNLYKNSKHKRELPQRL